MFSLLDFCFCPKTSDLWSSSPTEEGEESIDAPSLMADRRSGLVQLIAG